MFKIVDDFSLFFEYVPGLTEGGFGPYDFGPIHFDVTDMTQVDTSYILPIAFILSRF